MIVRYFVPGILRILLFLVCALVLGWAVLAGTGTVRFSLWPVGQGYEVPVPVLLPAMFALGSLAGLAGRIRFDASPHILLRLNASPHILLSFLLAVVLVAAAAFGSVSFAKAGALSILGGCALTLAADVVKRLRNGEAIEYQSHWGGLGAAGGGWRISAVTGMALITVLVVAAIVAVAGSPAERAEPGTEAETKSSREKPAGSGQAGGLSGSPAAGTASKPGPEQADPQAER